MKKAAIFDLDGTLLDTSRDIGLALETTLGTTFTLEQVNRFIGHGLRNAAKAAMLELGQSPTEDEISQATVRLIDNYRKVPVRYTCPYPTVVETLRELASRNIPLGVYSNKEQDLLETVLGICLPDIPFCLVAGRNGQYEAKPSSQPIHAFCNLCNVQLSDILYVGDSDVDFKTASAAGADYRILTTGSRPADKLKAAGVDPNCLIDSLSEILREF